MEQIFERIARNKIMLIAMILILVSSALFGGILRYPSSPVSTVQNNPPVIPIPGSFAFVSEFTSGGDYTDYGWSMISRSASPSITDAVNYFGEPSLSMKAGESIFTSRNVTTGGSLASFQFAINANDGNGTFAITNSRAEQVASISVNGTGIYISTADVNSSISGSAPSFSAEKNGWILITGNLSETNGSKGSDWRFQVFADGTTSEIASISTPLGYSYGGIELSSIFGQVYFTNIIFSSCQIAQYQPGLNNMEGYGQGSGSLVSLMNPFTVIHANAILYNWSVPQYSTLSFQINVMNYTGALKPTGKGFFQLGVDLDPNGAIAPWHVNGKNAIATYFPDYLNPYFMPGFSTPNSTKLEFTIEYEVSKGLILFQIVDQSVTGKGRYWNATIPYRGEEFYATYTQIECSGLSSSQTSSFHFNGSMYNITYGSSLNDLVPFGSSYMIPYILNAPETWTLTFYNGKTAGYNQLD